MPDYVSVGPQPTPQPTPVFSTEQNSRSYFLLLMARFATDIYAKAVAQYDKFKKDSQGGVDTSATYKDRAAGDLSPITRDLAKGAKTPLQIEVEAIIQRYQQHLLKVPDLASSLKPASENFSEMIENATGRRTPAGPMLVRVDPRSFDFADLLTFAIDRGYGSRVSATLGGDHGVLSFHYDGRAIDIRTGEISKEIKALSKEEIGAIRLAFKSVGVRCYDETDRSKWTDKTTGYHLHFDTATSSEVISRTRVKNSGGTRADLGIGDSWPARVP
jgi:hypothetical protein